MKDINETLSTHRAQIKLCDKSASCELSNDYTLPDYLPEIRRVLRVSAAVLTTSKYASGSRAEICGSVDYRILYVAQDGKLYSAPLACEYSLSAPLEIPSNVDLGEGVILLCDAQAETASARVNAPKRINVKCKISAQIRAYGTAVLDELISGETDTAKVQRLLGECSCEYICAALGETKELCADIDTSSDALRVIDASAELLISDVSAYDGTAECRGEAILHLLVCDESTDGEPRQITKKLPFEDRVDLDRLTGECQCVAKGYVSDIAISVNENSVSCTLNVYAEIRAHGVETLAYTKDIYSSANHSECAYKTHTLSRPLCCISSNFSQSERIDLDEGATAVGSEIVNCVCESSVSACSFENGKYLISGVCRYSVTAKKEGEYFCFDESVPFRYEFSGEAPHASAATRVFPITSSARVEGRTLSLDSELAVIAELSGESEISALSEVRFGEERSKEDSDIIICYPTPEDTLWSVSKRYAVPTLRLDGISDPEAKLDGVDYLIVNF